MEVLALCPSGTLGGAEKNFLLYARRLRPRVRYRLAVWQKGTGLFLLRAARLGIETEVVGPPPLGWKRLLQWARESDLLHSYLLRGHLLAAPLAELTQKPWVAAERGVEDFRGTAGRALRARLLRAADLVLPVSEVVAQRVREVDGVPPGRIRIVPGGLDLAGMEAHRAAAVRPAGGETLPPRVLCVAHLRAEKGIPLLLEAWALARAESKALAEARLEIAGEGPLRGSLEAQISSMSLAGSVRLLGEVPEAYARMPAYDLLVLPSKEEGFPNVVLEAQAVGLPVLAADIPGVRQFVSNARTGFLYKEGDARDLARRLAELLADSKRRDSVVPAARAHAEAYEIGVASEALLDIYRGLL